MIVEQGDTKPFNRAKLLNVGFLNAHAEYYAFHDVDMLPIKADYSYPLVPTHIATRCGQFRYRMPYAGYFGGVTLFNREDFLLCNGYSNNFWSWGCEDDEMLINVQAHGLKIEHRDCVFESIYHRTEDRSKYFENVELLKKGRQPGDGLSHCSYLVTNVEDKPQYKKITVSL